MKSTVLLTTLYLHLWTQCTGAAFQLTKRGSPSVIGMEIQRHNDEDLIQWMGIEEKHGDVDLIQWDRRQAPVSVPLDNRVGLP
jgi:hypothetical protein